MFEYLMLLGFGLDLTQPYKTFGLWSQNIFHIILYYCSFHSDFAFFSVTLVKHYIGVQKPVV